VYLCEKKINEPQQAKIGQVGSYFTQRIIKAINTNPYPSVTFTFNHVELFIFCHIQLIIVGSLTTTTEYSDHTSVAVISFSKR